MKRLILFFLLMVTTLVGYSITVTTQTVSSSYAQNENQENTNYVYFPGNDTAFSEYTVCGVEQTELYWSGNYYSTFQYYLIPTSEVDNITYVYSNTEYSVGDYIDGHQILARSKYFCLPFTPTATSINRQTDDWYLFKNDGTISNYQVYLASSSFNTSDPSGGITEGVYYYKYCIENSILYSGSCGDYASYTFDKDGTLTISGTGDMTNYSEGGAPWYSYRSSIKTLTVEQGITNIGSFAFAHCDNLTSIDIPNSVTSIGMDAFYYCTSLTEVVIPNSVTSIEYCGFYECHKLASITLSNTLNYMGYAAFAECHALKSIKLPSSLTSTGDAAFCHDTCLVSVTIPNTITTIDSRSFEGCKGLRSIAIPTSVTYIGSTAFMDCSSLSSLILPSSVESIGYAAFRGCSGLASIYVDSQNAYFDSRENCYALINTATNSLILGCNATVIPSSVTSIGSYAFSDCSDLESISIPNSVTSIESYAFYGCKGLTSISIPSSVTSIGSYAFSNCSGLTSINIPSSVTTIENYTFQVSQVH